RVNLQKTCDLARPLKISAAARLRNRSCGVAGAIRTNRVESFDRAGLSQRQKIWTGARSIAGAEPQVRVAPVPGGLVAAAPRSDSSVRPSEGPPASGLEMISAKDRP